MKKSFFVIGILIISVSCSFLTTTVEKPSDTSTESNPVASPTYTISLTNTELYCPSDIQEAITYFGEGLTNEESGNYEKAIEFYQKAVEADPDFCDAMDNIGLNLKRLGRVEESINWYLQSIEILPSNDVAYLGLANAYRQLGNYADAEKAYQQLIIIDPENPEGYFGVGLTYYTTEQYQDSLVAFKEAERLYKQQNSPFLPETQLMIGYSYFSLADMENAAIYLEQAYPAYQEDAGLNYYLGLTYAVDSPINDTQKAKQYLRKAQELGYNLDPELLEFITQP